MPRHNGDSWLSRMFGAVTMRLGGGRRRSLTDPPATSGYKPLDTKWWHQPRDLPLFTFAIIEHMLYDPTIRLGLRMRAAPLMAAEFAYKEGESYTPGIQADNPVIGEFVRRQLERIWSRYIEQVLTSQIWGWAACEVTYTMSRHGRVEIDELLPRHSRDTRAIVREGRPAGVRFLRIEGAADGHVDLLFPKALFHNHAPEAGQIYGDSVCRGAYSPWADKWLNGGALDVRRLFMHKDAYGGASMYYPEGSTKIPGRSEDIPYRDIAREIIEQAQSGNVKAIPSKFDANGNRIWEWVDPQIPNNPQHILQFPKDLDVEELRGMGIPDEVVITEQTGAWAGKQVPMLAFYTSLDSWLQSLLADIDVQVIKPLVCMNFGDGHWYEIKTKPLAEQAMEQQGQSKSGNAPPPANEPAYPFSAQPQRMSLDSVRAVGEGTIKAAELVEAATQVIRMRTGGDHVPAGARWVTIGGKKTENGERKGGFPVLIDADGRILRSGGPKGLVGKPVGQVGQHFDAGRRAKVRESEAADPAGKSRSWGKIVAHQSGKWGIDPDTYEGIAQEVWQDKLAIHEDREAAKARARGSLGLSAGDIKRLEDQGFDYGSVHKRIKGFDTVGRELASHFPSLGWGEGYGSGDDRPYDELLWELIKEGKQDAPSRISKEFHEEVDAFLQSELDRHKGRKEDVSFDPAEFDAARFGLQSRMWDEDEHPRNADGEFVEKGSGFETRGGKQEALFAKSGSPGQNNLFADRGVPDSMVLKRTVSVTIAGKRIPVSHAADGSTLIKTEGDLKVVTYTRDGIKCGYVQDADGGNVQPFVIRKTSDGEKPELPKPDESAAIEAERQRIAKLDEERTGKRAAFQEKTGHSILSASKLAADISKAGLPIFKDTSREKQSGVSVKEFPGKKTWLLVQWRNAGSDNFDHQERSDEIQKHLESQGYTVARPPDGDQTMLAVRKPLKESNA